MSSKPLILVTNDDGIYANGIRVLAEIAKEFGEVVVVAPDQPQSAKSNALTIDRPLRLKSMNIFEGIESYTCSGTPVDCVKLAVDQVLKRKPDFCFSGINHGSNASLNVLYSGTMAAAMEGAVKGIMSIGFSMSDYDENIDLEEAKVYIKQIISWIQKTKLTPSKLLNVNFPRQALGPIQGMKICRQGKANWEQEFDKRKDNFERDYYWLKGNFVNKDEGTDTDIYALEKGYISIVPVQYDLTAYSDIDFLREHWEVD